MKIEKNTSSIYNAKTVFGVILLTFILLCGCSRTNSEYTKYSLQPENVTTIKSLDVSKEDGSLSYGIVNEKGIVETNEVYDLKDGENFKRFINIENYLGFDCQFAILTFVNYVQTDYLIEGENNRICNVNIENKTNLLVPVELSELKQGMNDVIFIIVPSPNIDTERSENERFQAFQPVYLRCTVMIDSTHYRNNIQTNKVTELPFAKADTNGVYINTNDQEKQQYQMIEVKPKDTLNLYITFDNMNTNSHQKTDMNERVLILLKNLEQIDILGSPFIYTEIDRDKKVVVPYEETSVQAGYSEYLAIQINRPYEVINSYGAQEDLTFSGFVGVKFLQ